MNVCIIKSKDTIHKACHISEDFQKLFIKIAISAASNPKFEISSVDIDNLKEHLGEGEMYDLIGLYINVVRLFMHCKKEEEFTEKILEQGFTEAFVNKFPLKRNSRILRTAFLGNSNNIQSLKWRIDISLSNSLLPRKVPPWIIMSLNLSNNEKHILIVDIDTFHKLRFNVALMLKELNNLKSSSIIKK